MPDSHVPPLALALAGLILAMKPDSTPTALAFIAVAGLFGFLKWLEFKKEHQNEAIEMKLKDLQSKVDNIMIGKSLGR